MTRLEYIEEIEKLIKHTLPDSERFDIMRDYAEFFEEGKRQGKTEEEVMSSLGNPADIAKDILNTGIIDSATTPSLGSEVIQPKIPNKNSENVFEPVLYPTEETATGTSKIDKLSIFKRFKRFKKEKAPKIKPVAKIRQAPNFIESILSFPTRIFFLLVACTLFITALTCIFFVLWGISLISLGSILISNIGIFILVLFCLSVLFLGFGILFSSFICFGKCFAKRATATKIHVDNNQMLASTNPSTDTLKTVTKGEKGNA